MARRALLQHTETIRLSSLPTYQAAARRLGGVSITLYGPGAEDGEPDSVGIVVSRVCGEDGRFSDFAAAVTEARNGERLAFAETTVHTDGLPGIAEARSLLVMEGEGR